MRTRRASVALVAAGAVLALASPSLADGTSPPWTPVPSPNPSSIGNTLSGVSALTSTDAWTVGWYTEDDPTKSRNMLAARWDGHAWTEVPTPDMPLSDEGLLGVSASTANEAWAVGFTGRAGTNVTNTLAVHWNGVGWFAVGTPTTAGGAKATLDGVVSLSPTNAWAVGRSHADAGNSALIEHWDGTAWSVFPTPSPTPPAGRTVSSAILTGISAVSATDIWAVGSVTVASTVASTATKFQILPLIEHWTGKGWGIVPSPSSVPHSVLNGVVAVGANDVWAVGNALDAGTGAARTLVEHWDGSAWSVVPSPTAEPGGSLLGVTAASPTDVWAVGQAVDASGTVPVAVPLTLHWDGAAWTEVPSPRGPTGGGTTLAATAAVPATGGIWAVGATGDAPVDTYVLHR